MQDSGILVKSGSASFTISDLDYFTLKNKGIMIRMMALQKQNNAENKGVYKNSVFREFVRWSALPPMEAFQEMGVQDQNEFAEKFKVNKDTLTRWKNRPEFAQGVDKLQHQWGFGKTPNVVHAIYRSAIKGNSRSQRLFMNYFTNFGKKNGKDLEYQPLIREEDIRYLITMLPKYRQDRYHNLLRDLLYDSKFFMELDEQGRTMTEEEYNEYHADGL